METKMERREVFTDDQKKNLATSLNNAFKVAGLSEFMGSQTSGASNHLDDSFFEAMERGYHLEKDAALLGT